MQVYCAHTKIVPLDDLHPHPRNPNKHSKKQIDLLAKIMAGNGVRNPIKVSKRSGFITAGHGRLAAAKKNGWTEFPVDYQDYETEALEYADIIADNKIAELANLDMAMVNEDIVNFGPEFDVDLMGIPDFKIEPMDKAVFNDPEVEFTYELNEKNDYILIYFDDKEEFKKACDLVGLERKKENLSPTNNPSMLSYGVGRCVPWQKLKEKI